MTRADLVRELNALGMFQTAMRLQQGTYDTERVRVQLRANAEAATRRGDEAQVGPEGTRRLTCRFGDRLTQ